MDIEYLLTATRSARKTLDLDAPVDLGDIRECLRIGLQAANGSNQQAWRWLVVADPELRAKIAELYREAYLLRVGGQLFADLMPAGTPETRLMSSTEWLVAEHGEGAVAGNPLLRRRTCRASTATSRFTRRRCTARSSRRCGTFSWPCTPAATGPASRRCTCTAKPKSGNCSGSRRPTSRAACCPWAGCAPGTRSGPPSGGRVDEVVALRPLGRPGALEWISSPLYSSAFLGDSLIAFNKDLVQVSFLGGLASHGQSRCTGEGQAAGDRSNRPRRHAETGTRRTEILQTAASLIASSGLRTSLQEIADAAGILPGSLYHHFESKEAILVELIRRYQDDLNRIGQTAQARLDEPDDAARLRKDHRAWDRRSPTAPCNIGPRCRCRSTRGRARIPS